LIDDPQLTVRMVPGASPLRVVLDSTLRVPDGAKILDPDALTLLVTTDRSSPERRRSLEKRGVAVRVVPAGAEGVDLPSALRMLRTEGVCSLMVEGGAKLITSLLSQRLVDRLVIGVAPIIIGGGTDAVGPMGVVRIADGIALTNRSLHTTDQDVVLAWDVVPSLG
jgi:riboflavin-specific deaminase-like protein